jgi:osmotically inducible protein OsmC
MTKIDKVLLTGKTHTQVAGGGSKASRHDYKVNMTLTAPGAPTHQFDAIVPHPTAEQLFAGAWSACYTGAIGLAANARKLTLPDDMAVDIEVDLGMTGNAYFLQARLNVRLPGLDQEVAEALAREADRTCPYSKAVHGNIDVALTVTTA